jgi:hypothetical protein
MSLRHFVSIITCISPLSSGRERECLEGRRPSANVVKLFFFVTIIIVLVLEKFFQASLIFQSVSRPYPSGASNDVTLLGWEAPSPNWPEKLGRDKHCSLFNQNDSDKENKVVLH